jgi:hypothetical protein
MKTYGKSISRRIRTPLKRALAGILLFGIIHAVTFGSAHDHGNLSSRFYTKSAASVAVQASVSSEAPLYEHPSEHECLICMLHRQLFNSVVQSPLFVVKPSTYVSVSTPVVHSHADPVISFPIPRMPGRAPPLS